MVKRVSAKERQRRISEGQRLSWAKRKAGDGHKGNVGGKKKSLPKDDSG